MGYLEYLYGRLLGRLYSYAGTDALTRGMLDFFLDCASQAGLCYICRRIPPAQPGQGRAGPPAPGPGPALLQYS